MNNDVKLSIYVACLASYNNGILYGRWINISKGKDYILDEISDMLKKSTIPNAEEYEIHDLSGFGSNAITCLDTIFELSQLFKQFDPQLVLAVYNYYSEISDIKYALENTYCGEYDSEQDFANEMFDALYGHDVPDSIAYYINYKMFARDLFIDDYIATASKQGVYVFHTF